MSSFLCRDAYWQGKKLRKGPGEWKLVSVAENPFVDASMDGVLGSCATALGYSRDAVLELLLAAGAGARPTKIETYPELLAALASPGTTAAPAAIWVVMQPSAVEAIKVGHVGDSVTSPRGGSTPRADSGAPSPRGSTSSGRGFAFPPPSPFGGKVPGLGLPAAGSSLRGMAGMGALAALAAARDRNAMASPRASGSFSPSWPTPNLPPIKATVDVPPFLDFQKPRAAVVSPRAPRTPSHGDLSQLSHLNKADPEAGTPVSPRGSVRINPLLARLQLCILGLVLAVLALVIALGVTAGMAAGQISTLQGQVNKLMGSPSAVVAAAPPASVAPSAAATGAAAAVAFGVAGYGNGGTNFKSKADIARSWFNGNPILSGITRTYFIAAQEELWNFAPPAEMDTFNNANIPAPFYPRAQSKLGWPVRRYRQYTDSTFTVEVPQPKWLGLLGPLIRATVFDVIQVNFFNNLTIHSTIHPHGVKYTHDSGGAWSTHHGAGADIVPGGSFSYSWYVDQTSGPVNSGVDTSSIGWWYHSHIDEGVEVNNGLLGAILITGANQANPDATPIGVDKEFIIFMMVANEANGAGTGEMYHVNGYSFGNLPGLNMSRGDRVRWYMMGMGDNIDVHTAHWHGNSVAYRGYRTDVIELMQGTMGVADMTADNIGTWPLHCHVISHISNGMTAFYNIALTPGDQPQILSILAPKPGFVYPVARDI